MKWIVENWSLVVVALASVLTIFSYVKRFASLPTDEQEEKVREWLLYAVLEAEKQFGTKTGQVKLRYVYDMFLSKFPTLVNRITFERFSQLVDESLEQMRHLINTNNNIRYYIGE